MIMNRPSYLVQDYLQRREFTSKLKTTVVTFFLFSVMTGSSLPVDYQSTIPSQAHVESVFGDSCITLNKVTPYTSFTSIQEKTSKAFDLLTKRLPDAYIMRPIARFISDGLGDIKAKRVMMDCDTKSNILNVSYRLQENILLSVSKPLNTIDDSFVMFNLYHERDLLLSECAHISLLAQYIKNVEEKIGG